MNKRHSLALRKSAIAFALVVLSVAVYIQAYPYTHDAKVKQELESTSQKLIETRTQLEQTEIETEKEQQELEKELKEVNKKLKETEEALQAKRKTQRALAIAEQEKANTPVNRTEVATASSPGNCESWLKQAGIPLTDATRTLILKESGCRTNAVNPSSGACGIPQAYPCSKLPCPLNDSGAVCQLKWMDTYIKGRYGSWDGALSKWYSRCGSPQGCWY